VRPLLVGDPAPFAAEVVEETLADGAVLVRLTLVATRAAVPPPIALEWRWPMWDAVCLWSTASGRDKGVHAAGWGPLRVRARATSEAPLVCAVSGAGENRMAIACGEVLRLVDIEAGVIEETAEIACRVALFGEPRAAADRFEVAVRIDRRAVRYEEALAAAAAWWAALPGCAPTPVPAAAREPMLSTWYSFHQELDPAAVEAECRLARDFGMRAVILDDGWQTLDTSRGYAFAGDWEPERIPDLRAHVDRIHAAGLKVMLWFSVPFVGVKSRAYRRFRDRLLHHMSDEWGAAVLDPRHDDVREYLIGTWERAMVDWDLDGLKLDFVDRFAMQADSPAGGDLMEAVDRLLRDAMDRLRRVRPDALLEFRQPYIGPLMRRYGNMFRARDCPADLVKNKISVLDVRMLAGDTAVHSDMLMWHPDEPVESAALQLLAVLFAVPQISVRLGRLSTAHSAMLRHWLAVWRDNRDVLLTGELRAMSPELAYPAAWARRGAEMVAAVYADVVLPVPPVRRALVANATRGDRVTLAFEETTAGRLRVRDTMGHIVTDEARNFAAGVQRISVPPAGLLEVIA
jgi:alpha-galactosidase